MEALASPQHTVSLGTLGQASAEDPLSIQAQGIQLSVYCSAFWPLPLAKLTTARASGCPALPKARVLLPGYHHPQENSCARSIS